MDTADTTKSVDALNTILRGEISAVETYEHALGKLSNEPMPVLQENLSCHRDRIPVLRERIRKLGGEPVTGSGAAGFFANVAEAGASLFGKDAIINTLESGEDRGLVLYRKSVEDLDAESADMIANDLLPAQERTHRKMSELKHGKAKVSSGANRY